MQDHPRIVFLIESATAIVGTQAELARALGIPRQTISNWLAASRTCTPEDRALLAAIAGLDPKEELARATIDRWEGKPKGDLLMRAMGNMYAMTNGAARSVGHRVNAIFSTLTGKARRKVDPTTGISAHRPQDSRF